MKLINFFILISSSFLSQFAWSSSCCGAGSSSSLIILGDNKFEVATSYSFRDDLGQTDTEGNSYFNGKKIKDIKHSLQINAQYQIANRLQIGARTSYVYKNLEKSGIKEDNHGFSEIDLQTSYEYISLYNYGQLLPRAFIYGKISVPLSHSLYNSDSLILSDVRGTGLWSLSVGNLFVKKINQVTLKLGSEWGHFLGKRFNETRLHAYNRFSVPLGISYDFIDTPFSIGLNDTFTYQTKKKFTGKVNSQSAKEFFWEIGAFVNYSYDRNNLFSLAYSDSTLIGKNINSPLYRSVSLSYTYALEI